MIKKYFFIILCGAFAFSRQSVRFEPDVLHQDILNGIALLHNGEYIESIAYFSELKSKYPGHPAPWFFHSSLLEWLMVDYRDFSRSTEFNKAITETVTLADRYVSGEGKNNPIYVFLYGGAVGFRGIHEADKGHWFRAFRDGLTGYHNLKNALALAPDLYDAYYGLGMFYYWRGKLSSKYKWLVSFRNDKEKGLAMVTDAWVNGLYAKIEAGTSLIRINYEDKRYEEALRAASAVLKEKPDYVYCYWYLGRIQIMLRNYESALESWTWLENYFKKLESKHNKKFGSALHEVFYFKGLTLYNLKKMNKAENSFRHALELAEERKVQQNLNSEIQVFISESEDYIKKCIRSE